MKTVNRLNAADNYTKISNELARNNTLSHSARSILFHVLSQADDYTFVVSNIAKWAKLSKRQTQTYLAELREAGHAEYVRTGFNTGYYAFYELPKKKMNLSNLVNKPAANQAKPENVTEPAPARVMAPDPIPETVEELEPQPDAITMDKALSDKLKKIKNTCFHALEAKHDMTADTVCILTASYLTFVNGLTTRNPNEFQLMRWLQRALELKGFDDKKQAREWVRASKIEDAKDQLAAAIVVQMHTNATNRTHKSTEEKLTDTSWMTDEHLMIIGEQA